MSEQERPQTTLNPDAGYVRIGELARRTGVSPELLRAWEQRYGLLRPTRTAGGFRLYSAADEARVRRMQRHVSDGLAAAQAAQLILSGEPVETTAPPAAALLDDEADNLADSLDGLDEQAANSALDRLFSAYTVEAVLQRVVIPYLQRLGQRWETGEVSIAQEHFASNLITYLGTNSPIDAVAHVTRSLLPAAVVLFSVDPGNFSGHAPEIAQLAEQTQVLLAGAGATPEIARRTQTHVLDQDPVSAAELVSDGQAGQDR